jgi:uncharacterized delta-60 repeat protein
VLAGGRGFSFTSATNEAFALERLDATGALDASFGTKGVTTLQVGAHDDEIESLQQGPGGKLTAVGFTATTETDSSFVTQIAAARFTADGALDSTFGGSGKLVVNKGSLSYANAAASLPDGRVLAFGYDDGPSGTAIETIRFSPPPPSVAAVPHIAEAGDVVELIGTGFISGSSVKIGTLSISPGSVDFVSSTEMEVTVPDNAVTGKVTVTTNGVSLVTATPLAIKPRIDGIDTDAPIAGVPFGITGGGFNGVTSVKVGNVAWKVKVDSPTHLTVTSPPTAVAGVLTVTNAGGTTTFDAIGIHKKITSL